MDALTKLLGTVVITGLFAIGCMSLEMATYDKSTQTGVVSAQVLDVGVRVRTLARRGFVDFAIRVRTLARRG